MKSNDIKIDELKLSTRRKSISLEIDTSGRLIVHSPKGVNKDFIMKVVQSKQDWIEKKQRIYLENKFTPRVFADGELFKYIGKDYPLSIKKSDKALTFDGVSFNLADDCQNEAKHYFTLWYKTQAKMIFQKRAEYIKAITNFNYKEVKISDAKRRWGSCSYINRINLNWRLIMSPLRVIDYVILHELAHTKQKDHSAKFWAEVENYMPDYKQQINWLKENGHLLDL